MQRVHTFVDVQETAPDKMLDTFGLLTSELDILIKWL